MGKEKKVTNVKEILRERKKERQRLFTKKDSNNIMKKDYNPLNKDKGFYEREGLFMKETKDVILDELLEELNFIERIFFKMKFIKLYNKARINITNTIIK
ncbi:MAG: hypothetical protein HFJ59_03810 [Clostridia bacterium]|nr:hypothetical protein [Clostridia bacterium]